MRNSNPLLKLVGASFLMVAMVVMTGCAGDQQSSKTLTLGAGIGVATGTTDSAVEKSAESCCSKTGYKPANVKNECATPNSAGCSCCSKKAATRCDFAGDCKCCKNSKTGAAAASKKCDCAGDCNCCKACNSGAACECKDSKCCKNCARKAAGAAAADKASGAAVTKCDCASDCNCCKACKSGGKCECVECTCCKNCKEKTAIDLLLPSPGPAKR